MAPLLPGLPISVGDSRTSHQALIASTMNDVMETCQRGMVDYTFLGGAQIDMYGNLNSTMIGDNYQEPKVRFPGSGGRERPGQPLLEDDRHHAHGRPPLRRAGGLYNHARIPYW